MARINVEDDILRNPRFQALVRRMGGDAERALGRLVRFWWVAQKHWCKNSGLIPLDEFQLGDFDHLQEVGLAEIRDGGVYAKGAKEHFEWYRTLIESATKAGLKSAEVRREKYGTAVPLNATNIPNGNRTGRSEKTERAPNGIRTVRRTEPNALTLTPVLTPVDLSPNGESGKPPGSPRAPYQDFLHAWNDNRGSLPGVRTLSESLKSKIRARWAERPSLEYWATIAKRMAASSFCCEGKWASFHWLVKNDTNHEKVDAGNYDNRGAVPEASLEERCRAIFGDDYEAT